LLGHRLWVTVILNGLLYGDGTSLLQITGDGIDRAFNLFDALNELFAPMEPAPTVPTEPEPTPEPEQRISIIDRIRDFFSGLFG